MEKIRYSMTCHAQQSGKKVSDIRYSFIFHGQFWLNVMEIRKAVKFWLLVTKIRYSFIWPTQFWLHVTDVFRYLIRIKIFLYLSRTILAIDNGKKVFLNCHIHQPIVAHILYCTHLDYCFLKG